MDKESDISDDDWQAFLKQEAEKYYASPRHQEFRRQVISGEASVGVSAYFASRACYGAWGCFLESYIAQCERGEMSFEKLAKRLKMSNRELRKILSSPQYDMKVRDLSRLLLALGEEPVFKAQRVFDEPQEAPALSDAGG